MKTCKQVEHYFSADNLAQDWFLRTRMDEEGWVSMDDIVSFPKMAIMGLTGKEAAAVLVGSSIVEVTWESPPRVRIRDPEQRAAFPRIDAGEAGLLMPESY